MIGIGILGFGTVGQAVARMVSDEGFRIAQETGHLPEVRAVGVRDLSKPREVPCEVLTDALTSVVDSPDVDVVIEVMGGLDPTEMLIRRAMANGKQVITANKMLLAQRWDALHSFGGVLRYEAAVGAAVPVIQVLRRLAATQQITRIEGILNGTTNFILTKMDREGLSFAPVLAEAQALGYAETDPSSDVDGWDAAYKLAILASIARGSGQSVKQIAVEGIRGVDAGAMELAADRGQRIKLIARMEDGRMSVRPETLPMDHPLARVDDTWNAITLSGPYFDQITLVGRGAGGNATASAVVSDLVDLLVARPKIMSA